MSVLESAAIGLALIVILLPATVLGGGAVFVPWERAYWTRARLETALREHGAPLAVMVAMVPVFVVQAALDPLAAAWVGRDFTPFFAAFDGGLHHAVQAATPQPVVLFLAVVYLLGFPVLLYLTPILGAWHGDGRTVRRGVLAYVLLYAIALPFYFFFPVYETWTTGQAAPLVMITPWTETILYAFNDVDNAFPSMHTAMAVAMAYVAWGGPNRRFAWFAVAMGVLIPISTIVLGIHWSLDVAAGLVVAAAVAVAVDRLVPRAPVADAQAGAPTPRSANP